jgi:magnesium-transporting ATPase (P-type)
MDGLKDNQAQELLIKHGKNAIVVTKKTAVLELFLDQFKNTFVILLFAASIL